MPGMSFTSVVYGLWLTSSRETPSRYLAVVIPFSSLLPQRILCYRRKVYHERQLFTTSRPRRALHYITSHHITLHYITLHCTALHYIPHSACSSLRPSSGTSITFYIALRYITSACSSSWPSSGCAPTPPPSPPLLVRRRACVQHQSHSK